MGAKKRREGRLLGGPVAERTLGLGDAEQDLLVERATRTSAQRRTIAPQGTAGVAQVLEPYGRRSNLCDVRRLAVRGGAQRARVGVVSALPALGGA